MYNYTDQLLDNYVLTVESTWIGWLANENCQLQNNYKPALNKKIKHGCFIAVPTPWQPIANGGGRWHQRPPMVGTP